MKLCSRSSIFHLTLQIPTIFSSIILHMARRVIDSAPRILEPVRSGWVHAFKVLISPRTSRSCGKCKTGEGQDPGSGEEEEKGNGEPNGGGEEEEGGEENEGEDGGGESEAGEEDENGSGDE